MALERTEITWQISGAGVRRIIHLDFILGGMGSSAELLKEFLTRLIYVLEMSLRECHGGQKWS